MNDETRERLSALIDDELATTHARRTLDDTLGDEELRTTWERYHLIGDAMREHLGDADLGGRVRAAVEAEPVMLAARRRPRLVPRVSMAMAASLVVAVAAGTLLGVSLRSESPPAVLAEAEQQPAPAQTPEPHLVVAEAPPAVQAEARTLRWRGDDVRPTVAERLNSYLVNHHERGGMPGMHPYARIVSYEQPRYQ